MFMAALSAAIMAHVALPPVQFDRAPPMPVHVVHMHPVEVNKFCWKIVPTAVGDYIFACSDWRGAKCMVYMPLKKLITDEAYKILLRHETGHCNGWQHD